MFGLFKKPDPFRKPCEDLARQAHVRVATIGDSEYWFVITVDTKELAQYAITQEAQDSFTETIEERIRNRQLDDPESILRNDSPLYVAPDQFSGGTMPIVRRVFSLDGKPAFSWTKASKRSSAFVKLQS